MRLNDLRIGTKMVGSFVLVILIFGAIAGFQIIKMNELGTLQDELLMGTPSKIYSGWLFAAMELFPRIIILEALATPALDLITSTPATLPCREFVMFGSLALAI